MKAHSLTTAESLLRCVSVPEEKLLRRNVEERIQDFLASSTEQEPALPARPRDCPRLPEITRAVNRSSPSSQTSPRQTARSSNRRAVNGASSQPRQL